MATYNASVGGSSVLPRQPSSWASIVSGSASRSHHPQGSAGGGIRVQRNGSTANLSELGSQSGGRYQHSSLSNAFHAQSKLSQLPTSIPSYLEESCYAEKLTAAFRPQPAATSVPTRNQSTTSLASMGKYAQVQKGLRLDVKDTNQPSDDDLPPPLPTKWNEHDRSTGIDITQDGLDVQFLGPNKVNEYDSAAVRADHYMPRSCGVYYFEVTIMNKSREGLIGIGFCGKNVQLNRLPGWEPDSWGYHGDDGKSFCCSGVGKAYGPQFNSKDVIGCGVNFRNNTAFFTRNGFELGTAFRDLGKANLYPAVGMKKPGEHIRVNFGQDPFSFDIDNYVRLERAKAYEEIRETSVDKLCPPLGEAALIQSLIASYLQHDGFVETARAFANDLQAETSALNSGRAEAAKSVELMEDKDAINRQNIRTAILEGNIDRALKLTKTFYPKVLECNEQIHFRLRCRKFIEMMRLTAESSNGTHKKLSPKNKNRPFQTHAEDEDTDMEEAGWVGVGNDESYEELSSSSSQKDLLANALEYARQLQEDFKDKPDMRKDLEEAFSLFAYSDPRNSVVAHLLEDDGRLPVAEELNSAILVSLGKSSKAPLERLVQQTTILLRELGDEGGTAALVNLQDWVCSPDYLSAS